MNPKNRTISIQCEILRRTDRALLLEFRSAENNRITIEWFPLSLITEIHPDHVVMEEWIATRKGAA